MIYRILATIVFVISVFRIEAQKPQEETLVEHFKYEKNIVYKIVDGDTLDLILFLPKEKKYSRMPIMIYTHGGGWGGGNKYNITRPAFWGTLEILLENGIACASIEYRLARIGKSTVYDCVTDCKDAARFLMKNAEKFSLDVNRMGVWGGSAGGHLSLMTALGDNKDFSGDDSLKFYNPKFACVASYYPLTSFIKTELLKGSNFENAERFVPILGGLLKDNERLGKLLSPVELLKKDSPPILLLHGEQDKILPISQSIYLMEVAKQVGADVTLLKVKNAGHSFVGGNISPSMQEINQIASEFIIEKITK